VFHVSHGSPRVVARLVTWIACVEAAALPVPTPAPVVPRVAATLARAADAAALLPSGISAGPLLSLPLPLLLLRVQADTPDGSVAELVLLVAQPEAGTIVMRARCSASGAVALGPVGTPPASSRAAAPQNDEAAVVPAGNAAAADADDPEQAAEASTAIADEEAEEEAGGAAAEPDADPAVPAVEPGAAAATPDALADVAVEASLA